MWFLLRANSCIDVVFTKFQFLWSLMRETLQIRTISKKIILNHHATQIWTRSTKLYFQSWLVKCERLNHQSLNTKEVILARRKNLIDSRFFQFQLLHEFLEFIFWQWFNQIIDYHVCIRNVIQLNQILLMQIFDIVINHIKMFWFFMNLCVFDQHINNLIVFQKLHWWANFMFIVLNDCHLIQFDFEIFDKIQISKKLCYS